MNHAPGAGSIARPVDQQSSALPLYYGQPLHPNEEHITYIQHVVMVTADVSDIFFIVNCQNDKRQKAVKKKTTYNNTMAVNGL